MAKVTIDESTCVGCGLCEQNCPNVFEIQGDGLAHVKNFTDPGCNLAEIVEQCPVSAIKVE
ncbi:MAG: ferredoxin [Candidatus Omnitrophica bacterium]|nr:ferredoxin [Candidatus Omnitrophota bacterium]MDD5356252.1 ferredoxin [Candidatus Omnitrophota bacterium]